MRMRKLFRKKLDLASGSIKRLWLYVYVDYNLFSCAEGGVDVGHAVELLKLHGTKQNRLSRIIPRAH